MAPGSRRKKSVVAFQSRMRLSDEPLRVLATAATGLVLAELARLGRSVQSAIAAHIIIDLQLLWLMDHPLRPGGTGGSLHAEDQRGAGSEAGEDAPPAAR